MSNTRLEQRIAELEKSLHRERKISAALIKRLKHSINDNADSFALFERNILLQQEIERRTWECRVSEDMANEANQAKSLFLANMSHELRTPLHGILSFASLGKSRTKTESIEKLSRYFHMIDESGKRLLLLLDDLLDLAKLEVGQMDLNFVEADFKHMIQTCLLEQSAHLAEKSLTLDWCDDTAPVLAHFDDNRMRQVIRNLLNNSIKFSTENTTLHLCLSMHDTLLDGNDKEVPAICFSLKDEGIGIPENEIEKIFDKFIQSSKHRYGSEGTGLGLAICKEIVQAHQGQIWAEAQPQGSLIKLMIPQGLSS